MLFVLNMACPVFQAESDFVAYDTVGDNTATMVVRKSVNVDKNAWAAGMAAVR